MILRLASIEDTAALARYLAGRAAFIEGQKLQNRGDRRGAAGMFRRAVEANPANEEHRFLYRREAAF